MLSAGAKHRNARGGCRIIQAILCVFVTWTASVAHARDTARRYDICIEGHTLGLLMDELNRVTGIELLYSHDLAETVGINPVCGRYRIEEALELMLQGSQLSSGLTESGMIVITRAKSAKAQNREGDMASGTIKASLFTGVAAFVFGSGAAAQDQGRETAGPVETVERDEVVVTGTNIRGIQNLSAPTTVLDKEYIDATGYGTAAKLLESLPQNFALANSSSVQTPGVTNSRDQGTSINLRGVGEGTTLVLLNGRRLALGFQGSAVDISNFPLSAVERVEVLTDGASALYGSDAVGGVVNFVLRRDYEGAETRLRAGFADGGFNEYRASQTFGANWGSGGAIISGEYFSRDLLLAEDRDFVPDSAVIGSLLPEEDNYSVFFSGHQDVAEAVELFTDVLYSQRNSYNRGGRFTTLFGEDSDTDTGRLSATAGANVKLGGDWQLAIAGSFGRDHQQSEVGNLAGGPPSMLDHLFKITTIDAKIDGPVAEVPGGAMRAALGVATRKESFTADNTTSGFPIYAIMNDQRVNSIFGELNIPLVGDQNRVNGIERLELSVAGRYDDYSTIGSSLDPRVGLYWELIEGFALRGSYGTSYVAPKLTDYNLSLNTAAALYDFDPLAPGMFSHQLQIFGNAADTLTAQESTSYTVGFEIFPPGAAGLRLSANYYNIKYRGQINDLDSPIVALANPDSYQGVVIRNPSVDQVNQYIAFGEVGGTPLFAFDPFFMPDLNFDPASIDVILDVRRQNLSAIRTQGVDFHASYAFSAGDSKFTFGAGGVYLLKRDQQATEASVPLDTSGTVYNPPNLRLRGSANWTRGGLSANLFVNYTDSYEDIRPATPAPVSSYTTVDARLAYTVGEGRGWIGGTTIAVSGQNILDEDPPATAVLGLFDTGFDTTNANPLGRFVAIELIKSW